MKLFDDEAEEEHLWKVRESGLGATARIPGEKDAWEGWEDSAVPPHKRRPLSASTSASCFKKYGYNCSLYGHFGQGCIHTRIDFDLKTVRGRQAFPQVPGRGGRPGGRSRRLDLGRARRRPVEGGTPAQDVRARAGAGLRRVQGDLGPGPQDESRTGSSIPSCPARTSGWARPITRPRSRRTSSSPTTTAASRMRPSAASASASAARKNTGTMCPSYMVTKEEMHSTRGRAHLLFEMLQGDPMKGGWKYRDGPRGARPLPGLQGMQVPSAR